jgi:RNA polymerase sigma factor (sigma-70 family)
MHKTSLELRSEDPDASDEQLLNKVVKRSVSPQALVDAREAFEGLYGRYSVWLAAYLAARVAPRDLDDVHQAVWHRVWQSLPQSKHKPVFRRYLFTTAKNLLIDEQRKMKPVDVAANEPFAYRDKSPERALLDKEQEQILSRCLAELAADAGELVRARLAGESYETICQRLGVETSRAHKLFHEAKQLLTNCVRRALP